jgi:thiol:disulfide interchange protein DsbD
MIIAVSMFGLAIHCAGGMRDTRSMGGWMDAWLPPAIYPGQIIYEGGDNAHLSWLQNDIPGGMAQAKANDQPLFIDFTGYSCANCRLMEESVFTAPAVRPRLEKMARVAAYTDGEGDREEVCDAQREMQLERFGTAALPFYAIIDPHNDQVLATFADMTHSVDKYVKFLDKGLAAYEANRRSRNPPAEPAPDDGAAPTKERAEAPASIELQRDGPVVDLTYPPAAGGDPVSLSSLRGKWVLVNFWATWCGPCKKELANDFPEILAGREDVVLATISFDEPEQGSAAAEFVKTLPIKGATHLTAGVPLDLATLPEAFGPQSGSLPVNYLLDPDGRLVWSKQGSLDGPELKRVLDAR